MVLLRESQSESVNLHLIHLFTVADQSQSSVAYLAILLLNRSSPYGLLSITYGIRRLYCGCVNKNFEGLSRFLLHVVVFEIHSSKHKVSRRNTIEYGTHTASIAIGRS
ncbi:unnamed protein product [Linum tenue]|uniref:Uncharacterized protein n=1 Tax=Linum tenue TaxID=586396 RepID=A0AAV0HV86_9ROSI|nr:unnamed protein product [Linum tenue]